jgi:hypothetical protein
MHQPEIATVARQSLVACRVGQGRGEPRKAVIQSQALLRMHRPATAGPPTAAVGRKLSIRGGPARGGICLNSNSNLLRPDYLALRFAVSHRPACPTLLVTEALRRAW